MKLTKTFKAQATLTVILSIIMGLAIYIEPASVFVVLVAIFCLIIRLAAECVYLDRRERTREVEEEQPSASDEVKNQVKSALYANRK